MKGEQARTLTNEAIEKLAKALDAGQSCALTAFLAAAARFHRYTFRNVMLIAMQRPDATRVAGFNAWKKLGRFVKKGEKGIVIVAPIPFRRDTGDAEQEAEGGIRFKAAYVFDVAQTDGEPLPELAKVSGNPGEHLERLKAAIVDRTITLNYLADLGGPEGQSHGGRIDILAGLTPAHEFEVLAHELAHELLHHAGTERAVRDVRELEAEAVAFIVCEAVGLESTHAACDYIQLYRGDRETLEASLERIQGAAHAVLERVLIAETTSAQES